MKKQIPSIIYAKTVILSNLSNLYPSDQIVLKGAEKTILKTKTQILEYKFILNQCQIRVEEFFNPLFPFPDRLFSVFSALDEKANS